MEPGKKSAYTSIVYDVDDDGQGDTLWGIQWSDESKSDFDIDEMRKYCVLRSNGYPHQGKWIRDNTSDVKAVRNRLDKLKLPYYVRHNSGGAKASRYFPDQAQPLVSRR